MTALKTIHYRGGIARFQIPSSWHEEYEPQGGGTFFEEGPDTGTLRINVMGFEKQAADTSSAETASEILSGIEGLGKVDQLPGGNAIVRAAHQDMEAGESLMIHTWKVGIRVSDTHFRLVVFTYTILSAQEREPKMQKELELLDRLIVHGEYPAIRGEAGDYIHGT